MCVLVQPISREEQNGPGFHYVVRWRHRQQTLNDQLDVREDNDSGSADNSEFRERRVAANITELVLGGRPVTTTSSKSVEL